MRTHPVESERIVAGLPGLRHLAPAMRAEHERFDGKGYPDGLKGNQIPLAARILTVADAFDAMTSDRPYRRALSQEVAAAEIRRNAGTQFCPDVVAALDECLAGPVRSTRRGAVKTVAPALGLS
jgi:HD-GYP domain-containing protein (c-di-GMP phosphodiesterase class II)